MYIRITCLMVTSNDIKLLFKKNKYQQHVDLFITLKNLFIVNIVSIRTYICLCELTGIVYYLYAALMFLKENFAFYAVVYIFKKCIRIFIWFSVCACSHYIHQTYTNVRRPPLPDYQSATQMAHQIARQKQHHWQMERSRSHEQGVKVIYNGEINYRSVHDDDVFPKGDKRYLFLLYNFVLSARQHGETQMDFKFVKKYYEIILQGILIFIINHAIFLESILSSFSDLNFIMI
ncbi:hypothetical protein KUTeg_003062 [Tegillarca granosa]|uniref:Uncharacterized protein n=1 Tax=Tegillarca granosa TaxID=220873 RepID=A0ABQ9FMM9_TEGGR|nr:hypothetical protein KUTeg_003062 [Tegillarca granosa]